MKSFKVWFKLREELWHSKGKPERAGAKHPYHQTGQGAPQLGSAPPKQMSKKMRDKMKDD